MTQPWLRLWADAVDDDKLRLLDFGDRWQFIAMLCLKAQGVLEDEDFERRQRKISVKLGLSVGECETVMKRLVTAGLLTESWNPTNWNKRQFRSDSSTSRVRQFRKRFRNVSETDQKQKQKQKQKQNTEQEGADAPGLVMPNPRADGINPRALAIGLNPEAWQRWFEYRKQIGKPIKAASVSAAQQNLAAFGADQAAVVEQTIANCWQGLFALKRPAAAKPGDPTRTWRPDPNEPDEEAERNRRLGIA